LLLNCCNQIPFFQTMGSLKRKEGPDGSSASKSKRPKSIETTKDTKIDGKKDAKQLKTPAVAKPITTPVVTVLKDEEPLFPRGGGSVLTPLEQKQISIQAKKDVLFEEAKKGGKEDKANKSKKKSKAKTEESATKSKDEDSVKIESLNFKV